MLKLLKLQFGASSGSETLDFQPGSMTVFVGPNNSGKSLLLREIEQYMGNIPGQSSPTKIVSSLDLNPIRISDVIRIIFPENPCIDLSSIQLNQVITITPKHTLSHQIKTLGVSWGVLHTDFGSEGLTGTYHKFLALAFLIRLDGERRLTLVSPQPAGDLLSLQQPASHLAALFKDDAARHKIREFTAEAFNKYFVIDPTKLGELRVRMSQRPPRNNTEEQALDSCARNFHQDAEPIESFSDGVKAFTGTLTAIFSGEFKIILIDEPDAFLHPPLARRLGQILTQTANERQGNVLASTHSADFLFGCVQAGKPVNIVRLTYDDGKATAKLLPGEELQKLMRDPLLRSAGIIDALFHRGAVIGEGDIDRVFYEEINLRLLAEGRGVADVLFANAISKDTIRKLIEPLRRMGVPSAAIVDLDILKESDLAALLRAAYVPEALVESWSNLKRKVIESFKNESVDLKLEGIQGLSGEAQEVAISLLNNVAEYGVFIVPVGEVERWLSHLSVEGKKTKWLIAMFDKLGSNSEEQNFIKPSQGDVWEFVETIGKWLNNLNRKGMPFTKPKS